ncbi:MAG: radical SAM family heme chaperone HemW [Candidatus Puniceispirillaceae bacterium]|jgi:oxygen-independent coproporphyrinogen-3 oxidase
MSREDRSLGLYVHWPFCKAKCPYCDFNSHVSAQVDHAAFQAGMLAEMRHLATRLDQPSRLRSIFFGGGTPSLMPPDLIAAIIAEAEQIFGFAPDIEITAEANPTSVEAAGLAGFKSAGVNRVSLGIQALDPAQLRFLGREHSVTEALAALALAQTIFARVSIDLIYGLPDQTPGSWQATLQQLLGLGLDHLSLYQLTIEAGTVFHTRWRRGDVLTGSDDLVAGLFEMTNATMEEAGLAAYEVSNYARNGHECQHNLTYWQAQDWLGIGPGAHSRFDHQGQRIGLATRRSPQSWLEMTARGGHAIETESVETPAEWASEMLMMGLRLKAGVDLDLIERKCGPRQLWLDLDRLAIHLDAGLLQLTRDQNGERLATTADGRLLLNSLLADITR